MLIEKNTRAITTGQSAPPAFVDQRIFSTMEGLQQFQLYLKETTALITTGYHRHLVLKHVLQSQNLCRPDSVWFPCHITTRCS